MKTMIGTIIGAAVIGAAVTLIDQQNLIPQLSNNPQQKFFWDSSRFAPTPATVRSQTQNRSFTQTGEQRVKQAQQAIGNATREIYQGVQQQIQETKVSNGLSKYVLTN